MIDIQPVLHSRNIKYLILNKQWIELYHRVTQAMHERANELKSVLDKDECALFYSMLEKIAEKSERLLAE